MYGFMSKRACLCVYIVEKLDDFTGTLLSVIDLAGQMKIVFRIKLAFPHTGAGLLYRVYELFVTSLKKTMWRKEDKQALLTALRGKKYGKQPF